MFFLLYKIYHQGCSVRERHWWVYQDVIYWLHCMFCYCRTWSNLECKSLVCSTVNWKAFTNSIVNRMSTIWTVSNGNFIFIVSLNKHSMTNSTKYLTFLFLKKDFHLGSIWCLGNPHRLKPHDSFQVWLFQVSIWLIKSMHVHSYLNIFFHRYESYTRL